ncbi:alpha/beta hydrolase [Nocardioides sp. GY 10113]|uniref:alpha/beta hydrolase n=1 Tax=Nocardioides sp. GY 10113 TaxID=2569761 RepID=UPI0010A792B9|nr:alpha/beta hydrolase [Nocardioides sp. GY 10113]TIC85074.1 alpha/beta hydrolase [Nocardioides sp. GY 10113]
MPKGAVVAVLLAGLLGLSGCVGEGDALRPAPTGSGDVAPATEDVPAGLERFYGQQLSWSSCGGNDCAVLEVPIDYTDPGAGSVGIALERAPATRDAIGTLVVNPGGPGVPGTDMAANADGYFAPELLAAYDVVGFDPRGTGDSDPIDCLTDGELDAYLAEDPSPDTPDEEEEFAATGERFWEGCEERSSAIAGHVSTVEVARDMDVLRAVLGEQQLDYFGFSYGTLLGATYAELFPERVGRFALDGAEDPALSSLESSLSQAEGFETALRAYVSDCVDGGSCFLGDSLQEGLDTISELFDEIDAEPLPTNQARDLQVGNAFYGVIFPLYLKDYWPALDKGLNEALEGDGSTLLLLADLYADRKGGRYTSNLLEALPLINCLDDPFAIAPEEVPDQMPAFEAASPTFGDVFAWGMTSCDGIPFTATDEPDLVIDGAGAAPIVVIGTTRDPATPYQEAVALADELESGVLVSRDGDGHTAYNRGNDCIDDAVHGYLVDGVVPEDGLEC